jgi:hypothetical protein
MIRKFQSEDVCEVDTWHEQHGMRPIQAPPRVGFIVPGVAAGFLYQTDSDVALLEGYVTNPKASSTERHQALDGITQKLLESAADLGFRTVWAITKDAGISLRAQKHKMTRLGSFTVLVKELS